MGVVNGELADQANFNSAFMDREGDTDTIGKVDLLNGDSPYVYDLQAVINQLNINVQSETPMTVLSLDIESNRHVFKVSGSGGPVVLNSAPFGTANFTDGMIITVIGLDDTNTVTFEHNDVVKGCLLNGNAELGLADTLVMIYDVTQDRLIEVSRNF